MMAIRVGFQTWPEHAEYHELRTAWQRGEALGVDTLWLWDHFFPLNGDPAGKHLECWTLLAAMAEVTSRVHIGALVTCNAYRNPNLLADMARTVDHISRGRLILGVGGGWARRDFDEYGYPFTSDAERLRQLEAAILTMNQRFRHLHPGPVRDHIPLLIGGTGEKVTLRIVAEHAHMWNAIADPPEILAQKSRVLDEWCLKVGRNPGNIERSVALYEPAQLDWLDAYVEAGFSHFIYGAGGPTYDTTHLEQLIQWRDARNKGL